MSRRMVIGIAVALWLFAVACGSGSPAASTAPTSGGASTRALVPTAPPVATATIKPTQTLVPTFTPVPTLTPDPSIDHAGVKPLNKDDCPPDYLIKGNEGSNGKIYHTPGGSSYAQTDPERCFATAADALAAGFHAP